MSCQDQSECRTNGGNRHSRDAGKASTAKGNGHDHCRSGRRRLLETPPHSSLAPCQITARVLGSLHALTYLRGAKRKSQSPQTPLNTIKLRLVFETSQC